jgi:hypothetical protein
VALKPDQAIAVIGCREALALLSLMFENALLQVPGYANLQGAAAAGHDVGEVTAFMQGKYRSHRQKRWL